MRINFLHVLLLWLFMVPARAREVFPDAERIVQVVPSSDGKKLLVQMRSVHKENFQYQLFVADVLSGAIKTLPIKSSSPIVALWGPQKTHITFAEANAALSPITVFDLATNVKNKLTSVKGAVMSLTYSPSLLRLAIVAYDKKTNAIYFEGEEKPKNTLAIFDRTLKKLMPIGVSGSVDAAVQWFKDEQRLLTSLRPSLEYFDSWHASVAVINLRTKITETIVDNDGLNHQAVLSKDENDIAFVTNRPQGDERPDVFQFARLANYHVPTKQTTLLPETKDAAPTLLGVNGDGALMFSEAHRGSMDVRVIARDAPNEEKTVSQEQSVNRKFALSHDRRWLGFVEEGPTRAPQACLLSMSDYKKSCVVVDKEKRALEISYETITYHARDNKIIEAILVRPPKKTEKPLPMIVVAHGGPTYHHFHEYLGHFYSLGVPLVIASLVDQGFAVLLPNIRGSIGYGPDFRRANYEDLGGSDFNDILDAVEHAVMHGIADRNRMGIFGWSYGGFLCEFAATQTRVFKTAVCGAAISNWLTHDTTSEFKSYTSDYFGRNYSRDLSRSRALWQRSPALAVKVSTTPLLLLHGDQDRAVDWGQAREMFGTMQKRNATVKLAVFRDEGHVFSKPSSLIEATRMIHTWFKTHLNQD